MQKNQGEVESIPEIAVSYDMGWTKRGKGHNSLTGHSASMGLKTGKCSSQKESCILVLIGHNSSTFDTPTLLRRSDENFRSKLSNLNVCFGDSQILVKHLLKDKHPALQLSESASCKSNQSTLYSHLFNEEFEAHDALEDVKAHRKSLFHQSGLSGYIKRRCRRDFVVISQG